MHPTISDHSDTTTTYVEYQLDDLLADEPSMQQQQQRQHEKKKAKKKKVPRVPRFRRDKRAGAGAGAGAGLGSGQGDLENGKAELVNEKRLFSFLFSKKVDPVPLPDERKPYPWKLTNWANRAVFYWIWPILIRGYKRTLQPDDLWYLTDELTVEHLHREYRKNLKKILDKLKNKHIEKKGRRRRLRRRLGVALLCGAVGAFQHLQIPVHHVVHLFGAFVCLPGDVSLDHQKVD